MHPCDVKPGDKFGRWTVLSTGIKIPTSRYRKSYCVCECGNKAYVTTSELIMGRSKSCGCLRRKYPFDENGNMVSGTRIYNIWALMKWRCYDQSSPAYKDYGGRGITMCDEWHYDFMVFRKWALENGYDKSLTIDRIDNNKGYSPDNCRWTDIYTQANNMRSNHLVTFNGKTQTTAQWAREIGMSPAALRQRLKNGWSVERALTEPLHQDYIHKREAV